MHEYEAESNNKIQFEEANLTVHDVNSRCIPSFTVAISNKECIHKAPPRPERSFTPSCPHVTSPRARHPDLLLTLSCGHGGEIAATSRVSELLLGFAFRWERVWIFSSPLSSDAKKHCPFAFETVLRCTMTSRKTFFTNAYCALLQENMLHSSFFIFLDTKEYK
jgi:hypothetical protein